MGGMLETRDGFAGKVEFQVVDTEVEAGSDERRVEAQTLCQGIGRILKVALDRVGETEIRIGTGEGGGETNGGCVLLGGLVELVT